MLIILIVFAILTVEPSRFYIGVKSDVIDKTCDYPWLLKSCKSTSVPASDQNNSHCIQSDVRSCVNFGPIKFAPGNIEVNVYLQLFSDKSKLVTTVIGGNDVPIVTNTICRSSDKYIDSWNAISLTTNDTFVGYLNLQGYCDDEDIILINSIQFIQKNLGEKRSPLPILTNSVSYQKSKHDDRNIIKTESELDRTFALIFKTKSNNPIASNAIQEKNLELKSNFDTKIKRSIDIIQELKEQTHHKENLSPESQNQTKGESQSNAGNRFWNPFTIALVSVGVFLVVSITGITAYHIGKRKGENSNVTIIDEEENPTRIIPRVTNVNSNGFFNGL